MRTLGWRWTDLTDHFVRVIFTLMTMLVSGAAFAQSSVTLYGIIDTGIEYVTNIGKQKSSAALVPTLTATLPSRWGIRGNEDLGGGLKAVFVLESGFAPQQGTMNQSGRLFGRQAYVGLSGRWGTLSLGRQYSQIFWGIPGDTLAPNIYSAGLLDPYLAAAPRVDNSIVYSFSSSGLSFGVAFSFGRDAVAPAAAGGCAGQSPTDWRACKAISAMLKYEAARWGLAVAVDRNYGGAGSGSPLPSSSQTDTRGVANGYVKLGNVTVGTGFLHRINHGLQAPGVYDVNSNYWWLGASYLVVPEVILDAQFGKLNVAAHPVGASVIAARAMYLLSKGSAVYVTAGRVFNQSKGIFTVDGGTAGTSSLPMAGIDQTGVMIGIRHFF
ncbi:porin [Paraburkholderia phenoliruptrix]|uniref:porin n=1 Tax=Paraburkholderia phenoliruptrix TaxID=252970 RepID=UPI001C6E97A8|nr:porin [Paraburkholderia phenoliruptrix]MBW9105077.1 porin [Paraburkholderia phenoliruptrix]MBW9129723.1 porin [Paraburkholderia ginsengiterrae]